MEQPLCPLCGGREFREEFSQTRTAIAACRGCGLRARHPQPSDADLAAIYNDTYFLGTGVGDDADRFATEFAGLKRATAARYLDRVERYLGWDTAHRQGRRLLDVGPGLGDLIIEAAARGYAAEGIEFSPDATARANARIGVASVRQGTIDDPPFESESFDVCVLSDVIEHTRDPIQVLRGIRRLLKPGGAVFVATPSLDSWSAKLLGRHWMEFKEEHLFFFRPQTLEAALVRAGFEDVRHAHGTKTLSAAYVFSHFDRFPVPWLSPIFRALDRVLPSLLTRRRFNVVASGVDAIARRAADVPVDERRARLSVVMPVYNEKRTFRAVFAALVAKEVPGTDLEIIVVESASTDGTRDEVRAIEGHPRVKVVWQSRPRGKGHAVRAGLAKATGDFVLIQDADLEYDVNDYDMLVAPLRRFQVAFVLGIRHGRDGHAWKVRHFTDQVLLGQWMNLGHLIFTTLFNVVYGQRLRDPFTMYKVFRRDCLSGLHLECDKFDFDWELAGKLVRCGYTPLEIPVNYTSRSFSEGKKVTMVRDPLTWIRACFKYRVTPLKAETPDR